MKKIGIDARLYSQTGVGVYIRNLLHFLDQIKTREIIFCVYLLDQDFGKINFKNKNFVKKRANYFWHTFDEQIGFLKTLNKDNLDLMHFTYFSFPILYTRKYLATIHDLTLNFFKTGKASTKNRLVYELKYQAFKYVLKTQVKKATKIITPTRTVKIDLINYYGQQIENKTLSIYEGVNYEFFNAKESPDLKKQFPGKFFIYVGNFYPHKNVENLIKVFSQVKNKDYKLILIGPNDFFVSQLIRLIIKLKQEKRIIFYHNQSISDLVFFYKNAQGLIHPSLSEGFGLPIVEAMNFNLPIIASNIPVFKEILQDQYLSFLPNDLKDIEEKINSFIRNKRTFNYENLVQKYSFKNMAEKTLQSYIQSIALAV